MKIGRESSKYRLSLAEFNELIKGAWQNCYTLFKKIPNKISVNFIKAYIFKIKKVLMKIDELL